MFKLREIVKDREAGRAAVHAVTKSQTQLGDARKRINTFKKEYNEWFH